MSALKKISLSFLIALITPLLITILAVIFIYMPVLLYTEAECIRKGYPKAYVSVGLERYCSNLEGSVIVKVDKQ